MHLQNSRLQRNVCGAVQCNAADPKGQCMDAVRCVRWRTSRPPGSLMVSCGEWKTCSGAGHSGISLPGATPQMNVRLRDWLTPKLPAFSTPKRTCRHHGSQTLSTNVISAFACIPVPWLVSEITRIETFPSNELQKHSCSLSEQEHARESTQACSRSEDKQGKSNILKTFK
jgi:hypothetical protein